MKTTTTVHQQRSNPDRQIRVLQAAFGLDAAFWVFMGVVGLILGARPPGGISTLRLIYSLMMLVNAIILAGLAWGLTLRNRLIYILAVLFILANAVLSITDQVGLLDLISLAIHIGLLVLLFLAKEVFSKSESSSSLDSGRAG
jgi:hypothetical protein